jgi:hypothetical protein
MHPLSKRIVSTFFTGRLEALMVLHILLAGRIGEEPGKGTLRGIRNQGESRATGV